MRFCLDWSKKYFKMDQEYSKLVQECFVNLFERGLIYIKEAFINLSPASKSALADSEVETYAVEGGKTQRPGGRSLSLDSFTELKFCLELLILPRDLRVALEMLRWLSILQMKDTMQSWEHL